MLERFSIARRGSGNGDWLRVRAGEADTGEPPAGAVEVGDRAGADPRASSPAVSPDGRLLAVACDGAFRIVGIPDDSALAIQAGNASWQRFDRP